VVNGNGPDYLRCPSGVAHVWRYRGKASQRYSCTLCAMVIPKAKLQEVSDAELHC